MDLSCLKYLKKKADAAEAWKQQANEIRQGRKEDMLGILESRGYIGQIAGDRQQLKKLMIEKRCGAYVGIDPTAPSLHVGHLVPLMTLFWMYVHGFHVVALLGGATARVGDPSGRMTAREEQDSVTRKINVTSMHLQLKRLMLKAEQRGRKFGYEWEWAWHRELCNNNIWLNKLPITEMLRLLGPGLRMGTMLGRETFKKRMQSGAGMSFSEFVYPIMQSWDWWHMYHTKGIQLQVGGSDQFGNIISGMDAINYINKNHYDPRFRIEKEEKDYLYDKPMGFTVPLLTTASGEKFGKTAGNAVWLEKEMTSSFDLYQFFLRTADADAERYLKLFTFMAIADIEALVKESAQDPSKRLAQHRLAHEVLSLVHSEADAATAQEQHAAFFNRRTSPPASTEPLPVSHPPNPRLTTVPANAPPDVSSQLNKYAPITTAFNSPSMHITLPSSLVVSQPIARILYSAGLVASRSEGHRLCAQQGAYAGSRPGDSGTMGDDLEYTPCKNWEPSETNRFIIDNQLLILRVGKWKVKIIKIVSDEEFEAQGLTCPGWKEEISNEEREHLERQERDTNKQSSKDSRAKRLDRAFSRLLHDRKEERGGQWTMSTGKEVDNTDVRGVMGRHVSKRKKEVMAHKLGVEIGKSDPLNP